MCIIGKLKYLETPSQKYFVGIDFYKMILEV